MVDKLATHDKAKHIHITAPKHRTNIGKQAIIISEQTAVLNLHGSKLTQIRCKSELIH